MLNRIKAYLWGVVATVFALLLALVGVQRRTIHKQQSDAARKERDEQRARADELTRQAKAKAKAAEDAQAKRAQVEQDMRQGRRDYFEQD